MNKENDISISNRNEKEYFKLQNQKIQKSIVKDKTHIKSNKLVESDIENFQKNIEQEKNEQIESHENLQQ